MKKLTQKEIDALIDGVWSGKFKRDRLPEWLFNWIADNLTQATENGFAAGNAAKLIGEDVELFNAFKKNTYYFAANKTKAELDELQKAMFDGSKKVSRNEFVKRAKKINEQYNENYLRTEYNTSERLARSGREYRDAQATKDIFPTLEFVAVMDSNTRDEHADLNGVVRPVDDGFWNTYMPPLGYNCRCRVRRRETTQKSDLRRVKKPKVDYQFKTNVVKSRRIWSKSHPYFKAGNVNAKKAANNLAKKRIKNETK
jgi:SPP1 gp7 family putative phage head morphogenesis protein